MNLVWGIPLLHSSPFQSPFQKVLNKIHLKICPQTAGFQTQEPGRWEGEWRQLINRRGGRGSWTKLALLKWFKFNFFFLSCGKDIPDALLHCPVHDCCSWMVCRKEDGPKTAAFLVKDNRTQLSPRHRFPENISQNLRALGFLASRLSPFPLKRHFFLKFYFIFQLYNIVLVLPYIKMNPPQAYTCSPSWTLLPPPSPYHPSGLPQCTSPKHPVSCIKPGLATHFYIWYYTYFNAILPNHLTLSLSHRVQKTGLYISVSFAVSHTGLSLPSF